MSWADQNNQSKIPKPNSSEGKALEKAVSNNPTLRKIRAQARGETASDTPMSVPSQQYKDNYDKIDWSKK